MNVNIIKQISLVVFIFVSSGSFAQYKYDIGLKASTYDMERFQLEQRFHFDSPYSLVVTMVSGSRNSGSYSQTPIYNDSLFDVTFSNFQTRNNGLKIGVQRKLGFLASDVFYAGATLGMGFEKQQSAYRLTTYSNPSGNENYPLFANPDISEVESINEDYFSTVINTQLALSFGMDVPVSKRLSINAELGFAGIYSNSLTYDYSTINLIGSVSGGLRYQFGVRN